MQDDKFERSARELMDDLRFRPSDSVWPQIEDRIRKRRRRRILFFILPVAAALTIWLLVDPFQSGVHSPEPSVLPSRDRATEPLQDLTKQDQPKPAETATGLPSVPVETNDIKNPPTGNPRDAGLAPNVEAVGKKQSKPDQTSRNAAESNTKRPVKKTVNNPYPENTTIHSDQMTVLEKHDEIDGKQALRKMDQEVSVSDPILRPAITSAKVEIIRSGVNLSGTLRASIVPELGTMPIAIASITPMDRKIRWSLEFTPGVSAFASKPSLLNNNAAADYLSGSPNSNGGGSFRGQPPYILTTSVQSYAGLSLQFGGMGEKKLSRRSSLSSGLLYSFYSDRMHVGKKVYNTQATGSFSATGPVFRGNDKDAYTNQYHFIEIPLVFQYDFIRGESFSLLAKSGLSFSQLIYTNGLNYTDNSGGYYYRDQRAFHRQQLSVMAGLGLAWGRPGHKQWVLGPQVKMALTPLRKNNLDQNKYLFSAGLNLRLVLPGKSK